MYDLSVGKLVASDEVAAVLVVEVEEEVANTEASSHTAVVPAVAKTSCIQDERIHDRAYVGGLSQGSGESSYLRQHSSCFAERTDPDACQYEMPGLSHSGQDTETPCRMTHGRLDSSTA